MSTAIVTVRCDDRPGIVAETAGAIAAIGGNIRAADQHSADGVFCQRLEVDGVGLETLRAAMAKATAHFSGARIGVWAANRRARIGVAVSSTGHCLYDLASRCATGDLNADLAVVVSDRATQADAAARFDVPFVHLPAPAAGDAAGRIDHDRAVAHALDGHDLDVVVLARYMRIVGPEFIATFGTDRIINIHHSFLPAFVGANPYRRGWKRGVKLIGATAHYVTAELDAGPIIAQRACDVTHRDAVADLVRRGRDLEALTLADAIRAHLEHRVFVVGDRTIVF